MAAKELRSLDRRPPILLLRSFGDDERTVLGFSLVSLGSKTLEEAIVAGLSRYGPVIAIGRPGEELPPLGAAREYIGHDDWKVRVNDLMAESQLCVMILGTSEGLIWELRQLWRWLHEKDILIVIPSSKDLEPPTFLKGFSEKQGGNTYWQQVRDVQERWRTVNQAIVKLGSSHLPDELDVERVLAIWLKGTTDYAILSGKSKSEIFYTEAVNYVGERLAGPASAGLNH